MRFLLLFVVVISVFSCDLDRSIKHNFSKVRIETVFEDSVSIRAIELDKNMLMFAGSNGVYGVFDIDTNFVLRKKKIGVLSFEEKKINFRAIGDNETDFFILSIESPALLYKINKETGVVKLVYTETHEKVFYDAIAFWNDEEGIAMGDPTSGCLSIIITRDGGKSWDKVSCDDLPSTINGEGAFAASNSNIAIVDDHVWVISGGKKSRVFYSSDKGLRWNVVETPIVQGEETTGGYSMDFYDHKNGIIFGGDYTKPNMNKANKMITKDGGVTWNLISDGAGAGYKSCIRYIPNSGGKEMVSIGFTGISISNDAGNNWIEISKESFYTIRFINDSIAIAAGKNRIAKLIFN